MIGQWYWINGFSFYRKTFWKKNVIPGLKISDEKEKTHSFEITGNSHLLNAKNNEMCRTIHKEL